MSSERRSLRPRALRLRLAGLIALALLAGDAGSAPGAGASLTPEEALRLAFPECEIEKRRVFLTAEQRQRIGALCGAEYRAALAFPYVATRDGVVVGTAYFDTHQVRTLRETLMVVVDGGAKIRRIEVLAFAEPGDYLPRGSWYAQFIGRGLGDDLSLKRKIRGVTGATLTARATVDCARRVLALHQVLAQQPASGGGP